MGIFTVIVSGIVLALLASAFRVLREYERGVVFILGRFYKVKGPGLIIIIPVIQQMVRVDLRTLVVDIPTQDLITKDNVSVKVTLFFTIVLLTPKGPLSMSRTSWKQPANSPRRPYVRSSGNTNWTNSSLNVND